MRDADNPPLATMDTWSDDVVDHDVVYQGHGSA